MHVAYIETDDLRQAQARAQGEGEDDVVPEVPGGRAEDEALLVGGQGGGGKVRHGGLLPAQVPSVGEEVKAISAARGWRLPR